MYLSPLKVWVGIKEHALLSERENMPPKKRKMDPEMDPEHLVQKWNETMQLDSVSDSEEESVPVTEQQSAQTHKKSKRTFITHKL